MIKIINNFCLIIKIDFNNLKRFFFNKYVYILIRAYIKRKNETNNETGKFLLNKVKDNNNIEIS